MKWIIDNWSLLVVIIAAVVAFVISTKKFADLPTDAQINKVREWLLFAVVQAEKELGSGTGAIKLRYVYDLFVTKFPEIAKIMSFEMFSALVDDVLEDMKHLLDTNLDIKAYVEE